MLMLPKPLAMEPEIKGFTTDKLVMVVVPMVLVPVSDEVPVTARLLKVAVPVKVGESEKTTLLVLPVLVVRAEYSVAEVNDPKAVRLLPDEVTTPLKLAFVVTVPALPLILPIIVLVTCRLVLVELVKIPVLGVEAPIEVLLMVPPVIVMPEEVKVLAVRVPTIVAVPVVTSDAIVVEDSVVVAKVEVPV